MWIRTFTWSAVEAFCTKSLVAKECVNFIVLAKLKALHSQLKMVQHSYKEFGKRRRWQNSN